MKKQHVIIVFILLLKGCRSVKKEWVKENFSLISDTEKNNQVQDSVFSSKISKIETNISKIETSVSKSQTSSEATKENETTKVVGSITAEDGKTKSVTIGGTTIKSDGANVTFETSSSKEFTQLFESKFEELQHQLLQEQTTNKFLREEFNQLRRDSEKIKTDLLQLKESKLKEVTKKGGSFGLWLFFIILALVIALFWYFRKSIPFLK